MSPEHLQQLERLALLKQQKAISDKEFNRQKSIVDAQIKQEEKYQKQEAIRARLASETPFQRKTKKVAAFIIIAVIGTIVLTSIFSDKKPEPQTATTVSQQSKSIGLGDEAIIRTGVAGGVTKDALDAIMKAGVAKDQEGLNQLIQAGQAIIVDNNTKVKVIGAAMFIKHVRLLSGDHEGTAVWVPTEYVEAE